MRSVAIYLLPIVLMLLVCGCFSSRKQVDEDDSGFDETDSVNSARASSGGGGDRDGIDTDDVAGLGDAPCEPSCPVSDWVTIQGGTFMMGSVEGGGNDNEHPQHEVTVQSFRMSKTEVTVAQYRSCVDAGICGEPLSHSYDYEMPNWDKTGRENHPINDVNWQHAREFAQWLGGRLPSEAEWEYAARSGGRDIAYPWGNEEASCEYVVFIWEEIGSWCGHETTEEVCSKPLGNTAQGLCDMVGNVWEWVEDDWHDSYSGAPQDSQAWIDSPRSSLHVLRGGSWNGLPNNCRSSSRRNNGSDVRAYIGFGFRVVLDLK